MYIIHRMNIEAVVSVAVFMVYIYVIRLIDQKLGWHNKDKFHFMLETEKACSLHENGSATFKNLIKHSVKDQN